MLKKFQTKLDTGKTSSKAQPTDACFRCHKLSHWAAECPEGHEPEWLAQQKCFYYGQQGHIRSACPKKSDKTQHLSKIKQNKPPAIKHTWYPASISLGELLGTLKSKSVNDFKCYQAIPTPPPCDDDPRFYIQRSGQWFNSREGKINGSKATTALGWYGKKAMLDYWNQILSDLQILNQVNQILLCCGDLSNYLYKFWDLASRKLEPARHEDVFGLKQKSKEIALKSPCIRFISNSLVTPDALSHDDLKKFAGVPNDNNQKQKYLGNARAVRKMSGSVNLIPVRYG